MSNRAYIPDRSCTSLLRGPHESLGKKSNILDVNGVSARVARAGATWMAGWLTSRMYLRVAVFYILKSTLLSGHSLLRRRRSRVLKGSPRLTCPIIYLYLLGYGSGRTDSDVVARTDHLLMIEYLSTYYGITGLFQNKIDLFYSGSLWKIYSTFMNYNYTVVGYIQPVSCLLVPSYSPRNYLRVYTSRCFISSSDSYFAREQREVLSRSTEEPRGDHLFMFIKSTSYDLRKRERERERERRSLYLQAVAEQWI